MSVLFTRLTGLARLSQSAHSLTTSLTLSAVLVLSPMAGAWSESLPQFKPNVPTATAPKRLKQLHNLTETTKYDKSEQGIQLVRLKTLKQAAFSWGVQEGLYWRYQNIIGSLNQQSLQLHTIFDFNKFLVDGKMLLPSIVEAERIFEQKDDTTVRTVNVSYTLDRAAKLAPQPPTWRDYLLRAIDKPQEPHHVIFPRNDEEKKLWIEQLDKGWESGVNQANTIFDLDLRRLQKDVEGMYRFRKLLAMGVVTMPRIASSKYSTVKLDNGKTVNINDVVYSITTQSQFTETDRWEPFFRSQSRD